MACFPELASWQPDGCNEATPISAWVVKSCLFFVVFAMSLIEGFNWFCSALVGTMPANLDFPINLEFPYYAPYLIQELAVD